MAKFKYNALDKDGRETSGVVESTSESRARKELAAQGLTVSRLTEVAVAADAVIKGRRVYSSVDYEDVRSQQGSDTYAQHYGRDRKRLGGITLKHGSSDQFI